MAREIKSPPKKVDVSRSFDGKHVIEFNEGSHRYKLDGKPACGVTTFIKGGYPTSQGLISWQKGQALEYLWNATANMPIVLEDKEKLFRAAKAADRAVSQEAADIGTLIHEYAFLHETQGDKEKLSATVALLPEEPRTKIYNGIEKFKAWRSTVDDRLHSVEQLVAYPCGYDHSKDDEDSDEDCACFCGKFDKLAYRNGKLILSDYKSSKSIYLDMYIQLGAYALAIERWLGLRVEGLEILRFGKEDGEFETLLVEKPNEIAKFKRQAIRCRETYEFGKLNNDPRWKYEGK